MSYVYLASFAGMPDKVKIGISANPDKRLKQLAKSYGEVTEETLIVFNRKGYKQLEKLLHAHLEPYKVIVHGEGNTEVFSSRARNKALEYITALASIETNIEVMSLLEYSSRIEEEKQSMLNLKTDSGQTISTINLSKVERGQRINLSKEHSSLRNILVKLMWEGEDLDASVVLLKDNKFIRKDDATSMVYYDNLQAKGIKHGGDLRSGGTEEVTITLSEVESGVDTLLFVATAHAENNEPKVTFGRVRNAKAFIINADTNEALFELDLEEDHSMSTAVEMVRIYNKNGEWRLTSLEEDVGNHNMGLQAILDKYNV